MLPTRPCTLVGSLVLALFAAPAAAQVVISQVYANGGKPGATYNRDFVELFNRGSTPVALEGMTIQSPNPSNGSRLVTSTTLPAATLMPGQFYLVALPRGGDNGALLPLPEIGGAYALEGAGGKIALVNSTLPLGCNGPTDCSAAKKALIVDLVGFGDVYDHEGMAPAPALVGDVAAKRSGNGCVDFNNNNVDFSTSAPLARNSSSPLQPCTPSNLPYLSILDSSTVEGNGPGAGNPAFVIVILDKPAGPGGVPFSVKVRAGTATPFGSDPDYDFVERDVSETVMPGDTQAAFAVSVVGDTRVEPDETFIATVSGIQGGVVADGTAMGTIRNDDGLPVPIREIQGTGQTSPLNGTALQTEGIVTAVKPGKGFFIQSQFGDGLASTSEGLFIALPGAPSGAAVVGNRVLVTGTVTEFTPAADPHQLSLTQLDAVTAVDVLQTGVPLPPPADPPLSVFAPDSLPGDAEPYEGMRVSISDFTVVAPTEGSIDVANASSTADGIFHVVRPANPRPFREPGIGALDVTPTPFGVNPPRFDTNPERLRVRSTGQAGAVALTPDAEAILGTFIGVLDYEYGTYTLLPDPGRAPTVTGGKSPKPVTLPTQRELTIASVNLQRFYDDVDDAGSDVKLGTAAFERRLAKVARAICGFAGAPDILAVSEVENLNALGRLAQAVNSTATSGCHRDMHYAPHLQPGNDAGGLNLGFLLRTVEVAPGKPRVEVVEIVQSGKADLDANPDGSSSPRYARPPLMLRAIIHQADGRTYPMTVIASHFSALSDINSTATGAGGWSNEGARIRSKRAGQAHFLANLVQSRQAADPAERIVLLGDFNAFEFNDGYVDAMGIVTGREAPASQVINHVDSPITSPLTNMTTLAAPQERYSMLRDGNAQAQDHIVANAPLLNTVTGVRTERARINADFGADNFGDATIPVRISDRDPMVLYLPLPGPGQSNLRVSAGGWSEITAGKPIPWEVAVSSGASGPAWDVLLNVTLSQELPTLAFDAPPGLSCTPPVAADGQTVFRCTAVSLPANYFERIRLTAQSAASMAGTGVSIYARIDSSTPDIDRSNNESFGSTLLTPPQAELYIAREGADKLVLGGEEIMSYLVSNIGRDPAQNVRVVLSAAGDATKLAVDAPAGWSCGPTQFENNTSRVACAFQGDFDPSRTDRLSMVLRNHRSGELVLSAVVTTDTDEFNKFNNDNWMRYRVMIRSTK